MRERRWRGVSPSERGAAHRGAQLQHDRLRRHRRALLHQQRHNPVVVQRRQLRHLVAHARELLAAVSEQVQHAGLSQLHVEGERRLAVARGQEELRQDLF